MGAERILSVSPAFTKAAEIQGAEPLGRARRREIPQAVPYQSQNSA